MAKPGPKRRGALTVRLAWLREMSDLSGSVARDAARLCIPVRANNETTHSAQALAGAAEPSILIERKDIDGSVRHIATVSLSCWFIFLP